MVRCLDREPSNPPHSSTASITTTGNLPDGMSALCFSGPSTRLVKSSPASVFSRSISLSFNLVTIALLAEGYSRERSNASVRQRLIGVCTVANSRWKKNDDPKRCEDFNLVASFRAIADLPTPGNPLIHKIFLEVSRSSHHSSIFAIISSRVPSMHWAVGQPRTRPCGSSLSSHLSSFVDSTTQMSIIHFGTYDVKPCPCLPIAYPKFLPPGRICHGRIVA